MSAAATHQSGVRAESESGVEQDGLTESWRSPNAAHLRLRPPARNRHFAAISAQPSAVSFVRAPDRRSRPFHRAGRAALDRQPCRILTHVPEPHDVHHPTLFVDAVEYEEPRPMQDAPISRPVLHRNAAIRKLREGKRVMEQRVAQPLRGRCVLLREKSRSRSACDVRRTR